MRDLLQTIQALYRSEINCGLESFWDGGFRVWLGDYMNGRSDEWDFEVDQMPKAADWLHDCAIRRYPKSAYAETERRNA